ncbi:oxygenase MpaB family protein [uncultured Arthrobacter sp.]|uniref:oxygenase MpaB family protein n=1 Tax=uncultured Arthrobacter sp. TaxID=114050 RepID=UPI0026369220|nr:oxygenase MpaB family protein [uncultured Arthrobacter sp.]
MASPISRLRIELKNTFTGTGAEPPAWTEQLAEGDDAGYFAPGSAVWAVHSSMTPTVGGIRALLLQALHPGAMAGVYAHSNFREDPLGRLANTIRWIFTVTYGSTDAARSASGWVLRLHEKVAGTYVDARGVEHSYTANDPHLLRWVHLAFTDAFLSAHQQYGLKFPGGADKYVDQWAVAGELMGVTDPPRSVAELRSQLAAYDDELTSSHQVQDALTYIKHPPLPRSQRVGYRVLFAGAVATLTPRQRELLGLSLPHIGPVRLPVKPAVLLVLGVLKLGLGRQGPSEAAALRRVRRVRELHPPDGV